MACTAVQIQPIELLEIPDALQAIRSKRAFPLKGMQHDALKQVPKSQIVVLRQGLQHLEEPLFNPHTGLHPFHHQILLATHLHLCFVGTNVPRYLPTCKSTLISHLSPMDGNVSLISGALENSQGVDP